MPTYRVTLVSYRDVLIEAPSQADARDWAEARRSNSMFGDPGYWETHDISPDEGEVADWRANPDGTATRIEEY